MIKVWLDGLFVAFCSWFPENTFWSSPLQIRGFLAIFLVAVACGCVGSLAVSKRMAFFSDALAHCAFAGIALGLLIALICGVVDEDYKNWIRLIMVFFGIFVGLLIAYVQEKSSLPSDTVIGVFFAGAIGLGAVFMRVHRGRRFFNLESFLFGNPLDVTSMDLIWLFVLLIVTAVIICRHYNTLVFASFNPSLARSRQLPLRYTQYLFVALIGLIVNLSLQIVGVLLVNAFLIVPAAAAANFCKNMRHLFWWSIILGLTAGWGGQYLAWNIRIPDPAAPNNAIEFGVGGLIVILCVLFFVISMKLGPLIRNRRPAEGQTT